MNRTIKFIFLNKVEGKKNFLTTNKAQGKKKKSEQVSQLIIRFRVQTLAVPGPQADFSPNLGIMAQIRSVLLHCIISQEVEGKYTCCLLYHNEFT
jgi:hypothetical protein